MSRVFCGFSNNTRGKRFGSEDECSHQWRLYGKYMLDERNVSVRTQNIVNDLLHNFVHDGVKSCGIKKLKHEGDNMVTAHKMKDCNAHRRRFGLFPVIDEASDLHFEFFFSPSDEVNPPWKDFRTPTVFLSHAYSRNIFEKRIEGKKNILLVVAYANTMSAEQITHTQQTNMFESRGVIGYAFGYFDVHRIRAEEFTGFQIVRIFVNDMFRGTDFIPSEILKKLKEEAITKIHTGLKDVRIGIDENAPCFKLFTRDFESSGPPWVRSERMKRIYEQAGFQERKLGGRGSIALTMETRVDT